jgi:hypothetical protein
VPVLRQGNQCSNASSQAALRVYILSPQLFKSNPAAMSRSSDFKHFAQSVGTAAEACGELSRRLLW